MKYTKKYLQKLLDEHKTIISVAKHLGYKNPNSLSIYISRQGWRIIPKIEDK